MSKMLNSINNKYIDRVEALIKHNWDLEDKKLKILDITEEYFVEVGEQMPNPILYLLTEWFLADTLKSKNVDKVTKTEYPVLSTHQIKRRGRKQVSVLSETLDYLNISRGRQEKKKTKEMDN